MGQFRPQLRDDVLSRGVSAGRKGKIDEICALDRVGRYCRLGWRF